MKISAALTLFSVVYVAGAVKTFVKSAQLAKAVSTIPGAGVPGAALAEFPGGPVVTDGSQSVTAAVSSHTNHAGSTVNGGVTTHQLTGTKIYPGFPYVPYNAYLQEAYPGYATGVYSGFHGGAHQSYFGWAYPWLSLGVYPGFFHGTRHGFFGGLYPGLLESGHHGVFGGAYSRYLSGVYPGLFGGAYRSFYGPDFFRYGASERVRTHFAGFQEGVSATVDPLSGLPALVPVKVANQVVTIERLLPVPSPYPVPVPDPYPAPIPVVYPGVTKPGSVTTSIGTTSVSQSGVAAPVLDGSPVASGATHAVSQTQTHVAH